MKKYFICIILITINFFVSAQENKKQIKAIRVETPPQIDAWLNDDVWKNVPIATDFYQLNPENGKKATQKTEVKFIGG